MKTVTITEFRKNIFQLVDEALATGEPIAINRRGGRVIVRGVSADEAETRSERIRKYLAQPPSPTWAGADLSLEALGGVEGGDHWEWRGAVEPEP